MILKYMGHSFFTLTLENGTVIATDPYGVFYDYPKRLVHADICTVSHHHHDHDGVSCLEAGAQVIDTAGAVLTESGVRVTSIPTFHDEQNGALRGHNLFFVIEAEGLRIGHAGDLGHALSRKQIEQIGALDLLLLPVGGYYTIDAKTALAVRDALRPRVTVPMHYRTAYDREMPITGVREFLAPLHAEDTQMPLLRVVKEDVSQRPPVVTMAVWEA